MKLLNGTEIAGYIKERQLSQVRALRQAQKTVPKLAIVSCKDDPVSNKYLDLKKQYGSDILIDVDIHKIDQNEAKGLIRALNNESTVHAIIVQLPLTDTTQTAEIVNTIAVHKDVDSLGEKSQFDAATPLAILWLLAGYNIDLRDKNVTIVGRGKLVGAPLKEMLNASNIAVNVIHSQTENPEEIMLESDVIVTAVGKPGIISASMIPQNCVVVDAGVSNASGQLQGDLASDVYDRDDLTLTPKIGGVGPLTVCALFDNVIKATQNSM